MSESDRWWCWECANLGYIPDNDPATLDPEPPCPCCNEEGGGIDHEGDPDDPCPPRCWA